MLLICEGKERSAKEYKQVLEKHGFVDIQVKLVHITMDAILCKKIWIWTQHGSKLWGYKVDDDDDDNDDDDDDDDDDDGSKCPIHA